MFLRESEDENKYAGRREFPRGPNGHRSTGFGANFAWPKVGGPGLITGPTNIFLSDPFQDRFKANADHEERLVYLAACSGLATETKRGVGIPMYKPGVTESGRVAARMLELRRDEYASHRKIAAKWTKFSGFSDWFASQLRPLQRPSPNSPVNVDVRVIRVKLPEGLTTQKFDEAFDAAVRLGAVDAWAQTRAARVYCEAKGLDPETLEMATLYPAGILAPAREVCFTTMFSGVDRLVAIAEQIIAQHLDLTWTRFDAA